MVLVLVTLRRERERDGVIQRRAVIVGIDIAIAAENVAVSDLALLERRRKLKVHHESSRPTASVAIDGHQPEIFRLERRMRD